MRVLISFLICVNINAMQSDLEQLERAIKWCKEDGLYKNRYCEVVAAQLALCQRRGACPRAFTRRLRAAAVDQDLQRAIVNNSKKQEPPTMIRDF